MVIHSSADENMGSFHLLSIKDDSTINIGVQVFVWTYVFINFEYVPRSGMDGYENSVLLFWELLNFCPEMLHHFAFPPAIYEGFYFSLSLPTLTSYLFIIMVDILVWVKCILLWFWFEFPECPTMLNTRPCAGLPFAHFL